MIVTINFVNRCENDHRGEFVVRGKETCEILISKARNTNLNEFAATFLHELLHLWVTVLQIHGVKEGIRREHGFINNVLPYILRRFAYWYKEK